MAAPMVVASLLSPEPAASTTAELLELPQTVFHEEWNLVDVRERLSVSSDVFPGVTDPEPHGALEEEAGQPFRHLGGDARAMVGGDARLGLHRFFATAMPAPPLSPPPPAIWPSLWLFPIGQGTARLELRFLV
ncbi:unnamed protein product [Ectocarpus sp. 12 AP-2014]